MNSCSDIQALAAEALPAELVDGLADTFKVLADPTRVRILYALSRRELNVGDIATLVGISESAVSHQLRVLRAARLVRQRRAGQMMFYALDDHHVVRLFDQGLEHVRERLDHVRERSAGRVASDRDESARKSPGAPGNESDAGRPAAARLTGR
jgi:ArsR family transcriptional regulator